MSMEFQFQAAPLGQLAQPSWCLLVSTTYLHMAHGQQLTDTFTSGLLPHPLGSSLLKQLHPLPGLIQLGLEIWAEVRVHELRQKVVSDKIDDPGLPPASPVLPEPLAGTPAAAIAWHRVQTPMYKHAHFSLVVPAGQRPGERDRGRDRHHSYMYLHLLAHSGRHSSGTQRTVQHSLTAE